MENRLDELKKEFPYISEEELKYYMIMGDECARIDMESKSISHLRFKTNKKRGIVMTKKDLLEAIEDMPENMPIKICRGSLYVDIGGIYLKKLWVDDKQIEVICIKSKLC